MINVPIDLPLCQKGGLMKMGTCNVHIVDGHLMGVDGAHKFLRLCLKALKLMQSSLQELMLPDLLQWCPKVTGRRDRAKPLLFKVESSGSWGFVGTNDGNPQIGAEFVCTLLLYE
ncbi:hypothetical protein Peur_074569 [Populus x canadensis]